MKTWTFPTFEDINGWGALWWLAKRCKVSNLETLIKRPSTYKYRIGYLCRCRTSKSSTHTRITRWWIDSRSKFTFLNSIETDEFQILWTLEEDILVKTTRHQTFPTFKDINRWGYRCRSARRRKVANVEMLNKRPSPYKCQIGILYRCSTCKSHTLTYIRHWWLDAWSKLTFLNSDWNDKSEIFGRLEEDILLDMNLTLWRHQWVRSSLKISEKA